MCVHLHCPYYRCLQTVAVNVWKVKFILYRQYFLDRQIEERRERSSHNVISWLPRLHTGAQDDVDEPGPPARRGLTGRRRLAALPSLHPAVGVLRH